MKVEEIPTSPVKKFDPVTITITFESEDELLEMYHRHNLSYKEVEEYGNTFKFPYPYPLIWNDRDLFHKICEILERIRK